MKFSLPRFRVYNLWLVSSKIPLVCIWILILFSWLFQAPAATLYVSLNNPNPTFPYADWSTAATNIQGAIDAANVGDLILVTNGVYQIGGRAVTGSLLNRVVVSKALTVQSVNGPALTAIQGYQLPGVTNGDGAVRCVYLTNNAALVGFTLTNGATRGNSGTASERAGGGVYCRSSSAVLSNCVLTGNAALTQGGGAYQGALYNCTLTANISTNGGGAYSCSLINCALAWNKACVSGGGTYSSTLTNCTLTTNSAASSGGGAYSGTLTNCTLIGNSSGSGGGANSCNLINCFLMTNTASASGGGANGGSLVNCTLTANTAATGGGANSATMTGCVLTGNAASGSAGGVNGGTMSNCTFLANSAVSGNGGGANSATLAGCVLTSNWASNQARNTNYWQAGNGGGVNACTLVACALANNSAVTGGGAYQGTLNNCTLVGNSAATYGGGANLAALNNCLAYYNSAPIGPNYNGGALNYCCTTPLPGSGVNLASEPLLADMFHQSALSPCRGAGSVNYASGKDIDGEAWANPPSIGCDEFYAATAGGRLGVKIQADNTNVATGYAVNFSSSITGVAGANCWNFGDGTSSSNRPYASHAWSATGSYPVVFSVYNNSNPGGISATVTVHVVTQPVHYVAVNSAAPLVPYGSWAHAATNIQDAINAATVSGALVLVSNGVYAAGGGIIFGALSNRVAVTMPLELQSVNGAAVTLIKGNPAPGDSAVRCAYLANGAALVGFTLISGATRIMGDLDQEQSGGGIWCASPSVSISNCVVSGNLANQYAGGVYAGTLANCLLTAEGM
jgi:hypothetical protein